MIGALMEALQPIVQRVRTDATAAKENGRQYWSKEPLTRERLAKHLNGGPARGVCPIKAGESTTMVAVLDLDSHKGEVPWSRMVEVAESVAGALMMRGVVAHPWRSSGGSGMHLIALWEVPQDAYTVRCELREALAEVGLEDGPRGVAHGQVEVFPKQDHVPVDGYGNQFILPLAGASEPLFPPLGWDGVGREGAVGYVWDMSAPLTPRERPVREVVTVEPSGDLVRLQSALDAIPNDGEGLDYDQWRDVVFAIHHATRGEGLDIAHAFSSRSTKYEPEFLEQRVWPFVKQDREGAVTEGTIYRMAAQAGWVEDVGEMFEPVETDTQRPLPVFERDKAGRIESTATNAQLALSRPDVTGWRLGFDEFLGRRVIARHGSEEWRYFKDSDYFKMRVALERVGFKRPGQELVREAVRCVAEHNSFDSAIRWGQSLRWDGVPRVERFFERYMGVLPTPYSRAVGVYLWTALAGRCMDPGCKVDMVPVLIGEQGSGKTSLVESLAPHEEAFFEVNLDQRNEEQMARSLRGKLVGEIAELRGLMSRDSEDIKAWVTRRHEEIRALYTEFHAKYARRLVLIGTGNNPEFLSDETGERRWLPLNVGKSDLTALRADRDQLWAEGIVLWRQRGVLWQEAQTLAVAEHGAFKARDPWQEAVEQWLAVCQMSGPAGACLRFSARDVLIGAVRMPDERIKKGDEMRIGRVLKALGFTKVERWEHGKNRKVWERAENGTLDLA